MSSRFRRSQVWLSLLAAHLVVTAPSLCMAGLLKHPCDCESTPVEDCCSKERGRGCTPDGCSHDDCGNDPCRTRSTSVAERPGRIDLDPSVECMAPLFVLPSAILETALGDGILTRLGHTAFGPPGARKRIPYHRSDIPLLR